MDVVILEKITYKLYGLLTEGKRLLEVEELIDILEETIKEIKEE